MPEKKVEESGGNGRPGIIGTKGTEKIYALMRDAEKRTGKDRSAILNKLIEEHIESVVVMILQEEQRRINDELRRVEQKKDQKKKE